MQIRVDRAEPAFADTGPEPGAFGDLKLGCCRERRGVESGLCAASGVVPAADVGEEPPVRNDAVGEPVFVEELFAVAEGELGGEGDCGSLRNVERTNAAFEPDVVEVEDTGAMEEGDAITATAGCEHFGDRKARAEAEAFGELEIIAEMHGVINAVRDWRADDLHNVALNKREFVDGLRVDAGAGGAVRCGLGGESLGIQGDGEERV